MESWRRLGNTAALSFAGEGDGALLASDVASPLAEVQKFNGEMSVLGRTRLNNFTRGRGFLPQQVLAGAVVRFPTCGNPLAARRIKRRTPRQEGEPVLPAFKNRPCRRAGVPPAPYGVCRMARRCVLVFNGGKQISTTI